MTLIKRYAFYMTVSGKRRLGVYMTVSGKRRLGVPIHVGVNTSWFRIMDGAKSSYVIKRHHVKHNVQITEAERYEAIYSPTGYEAQTS